MTSSPTDIVDNEHPTPGTVFSAAAELNPNQTALYEHSRPSQFSVPRPVSAGPTKHSTANRPERANPRAKYSKHPELYDQNEIQYVKLIKKKAKLALERKQSHLDGNQ